MIRQLTHLAVLAVSLTAMATPAHARDDFMDKIITENGLQGCKRDGFTTSWRCTGKTGSTGANAVYPPPSPYQDDEDVTYRQPHYHNHSHDHDHDGSDRPHR